MTRTSWTIVALAASAVAVTVTSLVLTTDDGPEIPALEVEELVTTEPPSVASPSKVAPSAFESPEFVLDCDEPDPRSPAPDLPATLSGIVRTTDGSRIGKAKVRLEIVDLERLLSGPRGDARIDLSIPDPATESEDPPPIPGPILTALECETNELGEFGFHDLPCPAPHLFVEHRERLRVEKPGFTTTLSWLFLREPVELTLTRREVVRGSCRDDATDAPIPNAELIVFSHRAGAGDRHVLTTFTDPDGRFVTDRPLEEGAYDFTILRDGHAPRTVTTTIRFDLLELEFENHPTYVFRVKDATTGGPLSGANLFVENGMSESLERIGEVGATDTLGELRVRDLRPLSRMIVELEGYGTRWIEVPSPLDHGADRQVIEVELTKLGYLIGRVTDWSGQPLAGMLVGTSPGNDREVIATDGDGRFRYPIVAGHRKFGTTLYAFDPKGELRHGSFPIGRIREPGDAVDLGTVALVAKTEAESETPSEKRPKRNAVLDVQGSARPSIVEISRRRYRPGFDARFSGEEFLLPAEFVGYVVVGPGEEARVELSNGSGQIVQGTIHDGTKRCIVGSSDLRYR